MKYHILLLFVILSVPVTAQGIFSPGYIFTTEGDTLRGFILERSDAEMSRKIVFKTTKESEIQKHSTKTLSGFGFDSGREFETMILLPKPGKNEDTTYIFAKNMLRGHTDVFVGRYIQKGHPEILFRNNSNNSSNQIYRSRDSNSLGMDEFLNSYYSDSKFLHNPQGVRFQEKKILREIAKQNNIYSADFPDSVYKEKIDYDWTILAGMPADYSKDAIHFRGAVYLSRTKTERSSGISSIHGIIYHHWERKNTAFPGTHQYGMITDKWQMINVMPIGIKIQDYVGDFRPYGYLGAGVAMLREDIISFDNAPGMEGGVTWSFLPTFNMGIGIKTRLGKNFLVTELTPTINNLMLNIGLSI